MSDWGHLLSGMRVVESPLCEMTVPVKKHKKRRNQSVAYHARIQKKWLKRFGTKKERFAYMINPSAFGLYGGPTIAIHPRDFAFLRNFSI